MSVTNTPSPQAPGATEAVVLRDDERQRCEIWTRVYGLPPPSSLLQHRQER